MREPAARSGARSKGREAGRADAAINGPAVIAGSGARGAQAAGHEEGDTICLFHGLLLVGWVDEGRKSASGAQPASIEQRELERLILRA